MSSAFYPLGMKKYNNQVPQGGYKTWKGNGIFSNPIGITRTNIRPLTNKDTGNQFPTGFGLPRPIKHYRKGSLPPNSEVTSLLETDQMVAHNLDRHVKSSMGGGLIKVMLDTPGSFSIKNNTYVDGIDEKCNNCNGIAVVSDWNPVTSLTDKPQPNVMSNEFCCNKENKAIRMCLPNSTILNKKYYQTTYSKLYNRCNTFNQKQYSYLSLIGDSELLEELKTNQKYTTAFINAIKPGSPLAIQLDYQYSAQCNPNYIIEKSEEIEYINLVSNYLYSSGMINQEQLESLRSLSIKDFIETLLTMVDSETYDNILNQLYNTINISLLEDRKCSKNIFKPNNYKYSKQGAVSSSNRILQLNVETINKNLSQIKKGLNNKNNLCKDYCYHPYKL
jgi:hypothetical protein